MTPEEKATWRQRVLEQVLTPEFQARYHEIYAKGDPSECWEWTGPRRRGQYGIVSVLGKPMGAHVVAWIIDSGKHPGDMFICHSCDNPPCVNPAHLWPGTAAENVKDCVQKGRHVSGNKRATHKIEPGQRYLCLSKRTERRVITVIAMTGWKFRGLNLWETNDGKRTKHIQEDQLRLTYQYKLIEG